MWKRGTRDKNAVQSHIKRNIWSLYTNIGTVKLKT